MNNKKHLMSTENNWMTPHPITTTAEIQGMETLIKPDEIAFVTEIEWYELRQTTKDGYEVVCFNYEGDEYLYRIDMYISRDYLEELGNSMNLAEFALSHNLV